MKKLLLIFILAYPGSLCAINITVTWAAVNKNVKGDYVMSGVTYNVYRSTAKPDGSQDVSTRAKVNTSPIVGASFLDSVPDDPDGIYFYEITCQAPNQIESAKSEVAPSIISNYRMLTPTGAKAVPKVITASAAKRAKK